MRSITRTRRSLKNLRDSVVSGTLNKDKRLVFAIKQSLWALYRTQLSFGTPTEKSPGADPQLAARVSEKARASLAALGAVQLRKLTKKFAAARAKKVAAMDGTAAVVWVNT